MTSVYKFAEKNIEIASLHGEVHALCHDYKSGEAPELTVKIKESDIEYERKRSAAEDEKAGITTRSFPDSYLETLAVYRQISEQMIEWDTLLFHGSAVSVDGEAYLFTAKSGTGKSTHTRLWRELLGQRAVMVNDDKPLLHITDSCVTVHGTPWDGKHRLSSNISVPLRAVCILERAETNHIERITRGEAYPMLIQQSYRSADPEKMSKILTLIDKLTAAVPLYRLGCNTKITAAEIAYNEMKGKKYEA